MLPNSIKKIKTSNKKHEKGDLYLLNLFKQSSSLLKIILDCENICGVKSVEFWIIYWAYWSNTVTSSLRWSKISFLKKKYNDSLIFAINKNKQNLILVWNGHHLTQKGNRPYIVLDLKNCPWKYCINQDNWQWKDFVNAWI